MNEAELFDHKFIVCVDGEIFFCDKFAVNISDSIFIYWYDGKQYQVKNVKKVEVVDPEKD